MSMSLRHPLAINSNLENILACQAMFPVTSGTEVAGQTDENTIADALTDANSIDLRKDQNVITGVPGGLPIND